MFALTLHYVCAHSGALWYKMKMFTKLSNELVNDSR